MEEKKEENVVVMEENKTEDKIWIEDVGADGIDYGVMGDRILTALEQFCGIKDAKFIYIYKKRRTSS